MRKLNLTKAQKKEANRKCKQVSREKKKNAMSNPEWILQIVINLVNKIPKVASLGPLRY